MGLPKMKPVWSYDLKEEAAFIPTLLVLGYVSLGHALGLCLLTQAGIGSASLGVLLTAHSMVLAAYLVHEAAHMTLFRHPRHNAFLGEIMAFLCGAAYASFDRIRHMHLRHHRDRADVGRFDYKALLRQLPVPLRRAVYVLEWAYIPAIELIMQFQLLVRPFTNPVEHDRRGRVVGVLLARGALFTLLTVIGGLRALALYALAWGLFLTVMHFFDAFHHTFDQYFVADDEEKVSMEGKDREYEQANTYSNVVSVRWPSLNLLTLNFGYHNAHHQRAATPWYRLPALHRELYGEAGLQLMPLSELLRTFHRHRLRRILDEDYGAVGTGDRRADNFVGAHGVSFLTVV
jgi:fatty acid desaturase